MGSLDMTVLFALAVALNIFGSYVEKGPKKYLLWGMSILYLGVFLISALIILGVKEKSLYAIIYILCGMFSCVGWPSCIFVSLILYRFFHIICRLV